MKFSFLIRIFQSKQVQNEVSPHYTTLNFHNSYITDSITITITITYIQTQLYIVFQYLSSHCIIIASSCKGSAQLCNFSCGFVNGNYIPETSLKQNLNSQKTKSLFIMSKFSAVESKATTGISVSIGTSMYSFQEICQRAKLILVHMTLSIKIHVPRYTDFAQVPMILLQQ